MILIIGGHQRSGTSLITELLNGHPDMAITPEFGVFLRIRNPYTVYCLKMMSRLWEAGNRPLSPSDFDKHAFPFRNLVFVSHYLSRLSQLQGNRAERVEAALRMVLPDAGIVGDKYPDYVYSLDTLLCIPGLSCLVMYRDCRDVVSSTLAAVRTIWRRKRFLRMLDSAEKVAKRWVLAIEIMERYSAELYSVRYENLVARPDQELANLAQWLNVDPAGFPSHIVCDSSIEKYKQGLSRDELSTVLDVAGPTMERVGYKT